MVRATILRKISMLEREMEWWRIWCRIAAKDAGRKTEGDVHNSLTASER
jgi:hypothetical protein